jgi:hypothetical protein
MQLHARAILCAMARSTLALFYGTRACKGATGATRATHLAWRLRHSSCALQPNRSRKERQGHYGKDSKGRPHAGRA